MKTCWFVVIKSYDRWWVDREGRMFGPVDDRDEAVSYARMLAEAHGDPERQSQVWLYEEVGRPVLIWSDEEFGMQSRS